MKKQKTKQSILILISTCFLLLSIYLISAILSGGVPEGTTGCLVKTSDEAERTIKNFIKGG